MSDVHKTRELVEGYVSENMSAADFANSFTPILNFALKSTDQPARELAVAVHAYISHYFHGLIAEQQLRSNLASVCDVSSVYPMVVTMPTPSEKFEAFAVGDCGQLTPA